MACNLKESPLRYETEGKENGSSVTAVIENEQDSNPASPLSITGIVQRNLGHASDPSNNVKESIYNFDEEEEQSIAPKTKTPNISTVIAKKAKLPFSKSIHVNDENKTHQKLSNSPIAAAYVLTNKIKDRPTPAMIFVAKKSRPVLENEGLDEMKARSKKKHKKKHSKNLLKEKETEKPVKIEKIDQRILSLDTSRNLYKEGYLVWAKIRGFSYWPGIITVDPMDGLTVKFMKLNSDIPYSHVHFLGYERTQRAWLPETNIMEFKGIDHFVMMGSKIPANSAKKKDFTPKKTLMERFEKGMDLAESVLPFSFRQRLEKLDLVYVLIPALKEKEEKDPMSPEEQEEGTKNTKGVKKKRKSGDYDSENSATSGKNKKRKKDNEKLEPISLNKTINVPDTELSSQVEVESSQSLEHESSEDQSTVKKPKHKRSKSVNDQKIRKLKLATNVNKISIKKVEKCEEPKPAKRGRKKKHIREPIVSDGTLKGEKMAKKLNNKRKKLTIDSAVKDDACIDSPTEKLKFGDTEECGMGVTVRVSSPIEDTSETEIKDISGSLKTDEFESDLDEPNEMDDSTNNTQLKSGYHGEGAMVPKLGSLVWGRLPGFPYWPCFVTKCPDTGEYRRMYDANKRCDYHVQFFNWNNESGWVRNTKPWCTLETFQAMAKTATKRLVPTSKEYKAWRPTGKLLQKWTDAFNQAQSTSGMTRRERHNGNIVFCRSKMEQSKLTTLITEGPHAKKRRKSSSIDSHNSETTCTGKNESPAESKVLATSNPTKLQQQKKPPKQLGFRKPCPKSVQIRRRNSQQPNAKLNKNKIYLMPQVSKDPQLPPGWSSKVINPDNSRIEHEYKSPEGMVFSSLKGATAYLFHQNSLQSKGKHKNNKFEAPNHNGFTQSHLKRRHRSYSLNAAHLPSYQTGLQGNERNIDAHKDNVDLGCNGWFLISSDKMHYGVPERGLTDIEGKVGNLETGSVEYLRDLSLPSSWTIKKTWKKGESLASKIDAEALMNYVSQKFGEEHTQKFKSKLELVHYLEGIGHPAIQLEQMLRNFKKIETQRTAHPLTLIASEDSNLPTEDLQRKEEKEVEHIEDAAKNSDDHDVEESDESKCVLSPINLCEWSVDQARRHPILGRAVTPCYVDMVQLPGIFLQHPSVIVEESENEMVISDYYTKEFIAKKIIYD